MEHQPRGINGAHVLVDNGRADGTSLSTLLAIVPSVPTDCCAFLFLSYAQFTQRGSLEISIDPSRAVGPSATLQPVKLPDASQMEVTINADFSQGSLTESCLSVELHFVKKNSFSTARKCFCQPAAGNATAVPQQYRVRKALKHVNPQHRMHVLETSLPTDVSPILGYMVAFIEYTAIVGSPLNVLVKYIKARSATYRKLKTLDEVLRLSWTLTGRYATNGCFTLHRT